MSTATIDQPTAPTTAIHIGPEILYPTEQRLDASHRCDAGAFKPTNLGTAVKDDKGRAMVAPCGAQAYVVVEFVSGELEFCANHFARNAGKFNSALRIRDERAFVLPEKQPYKGNGLN